MRFLASKTGLSRPSSVSTGRSKVHFLLQFFFVCGVCFVIVCSLPLLVLVPQEDCFLIVAFLGYVPFYFLLQNQSYHDNDFYFFQRMFIHSFCRIFFNRNVIKDTLRTEIFWFSFISSSFFFLYSSQEHIKGLLILIIIPRANFVCRGGGGGRGGYTVFTLSVRLSVRSCVRPRRWFFHNILKMQ